MTQVEFVNDAPAVGVPVRFAELSLGNGQYRGNLYDGVTLKRHGQGRMKYKDGSVYLGDWHMDVIHGNGILKYANKSVYDGQWNMGNYHGHGYLAMAVAHRCYDTYLGEVCARWFARSH